MEPATSAIVRSLAAPGFWGGLIRGSNLRVRTEITVERSIRQHGEYGHAGTLRDSTQARVVGLGRMVAPYEIRQSNEFGSVFRCTKILYCLFQFGIIDAIRCLRIMHGLVLKRIVAQIEWNNPLRLYKAAQTRLDGQRAYQPGPQIRTRLNH